MKTAVCCIACQENDYIKEWVDYYLGLGVDDIYIYDNNKSYEANEHFEDVLDLSLYKNVHIIDKRDIVEQSFQTNCYNEFYKNYGNNYDWICFFDCDEFLTMYGFDNIKDFLAQDKFKDFHIIKINWLSYNDNGHILKEEGKVQDRFPIESDVQRQEICWENRLLKSIVRGSLDTNIIHIGIHTPVPIQDGQILAVNIGDPTYKQQKERIEKNYKWIYRVCFADGEESFDICYPNCFSPSDPKYDDAVIKHYRTKSCQEYIETKSRRGFQDCSKSILNIGTYFYFNDYTKEKMEYFVSNGKCELPIFLIESTNDNLGEMMFTYIAAKYAMTLSEHSYNLYWRFDEFMNLKEKIKNTSLFSDANVFPQTLLVDIKYSKNCTEYHYYQNIKKSPIKYVYEPIIVKPGRNISIHGDHTSPQYFGFDKNFAYSLFKNEEIENNIKQRYNENFSNTAAVYVNKNTNPSHLIKFFNLYTNNVKYYILYDNFVEASNILAAVFDKLTFPLSVCWCNNPSELYSREVFNMYFMSLCRVNFLDFSNPTMWWGAYLNNNDLADILVPYDGNSILSVLFPFGDDRYKNIS